MENTRVMVTIKPRNMKINQPIADGLDQDASGNMNKAVSHLCAVSVGLVG